MREVILDTETTGLDPAAGHRIVEIGCLELINHVPTGRVYQQYVNPEREMPARAEEVHGLTSDFLSDKPTFRDIADDFLEFIGSASVIAHNAAFDLGFINAELAQINSPAIPENRMVDTVAIARRRFPGSQASLDALCRRFNVDNSARTKHGALLDAELLAEVYLELVGGREPGLALAEQEDGASAAGEPEKEVRVPRPHLPTANEEEEHKVLVDRLTGALWKL